MYRDGFIFKSDILAKTWNFAELLQIGLENKMVPFEEHVHFDTLWWCCNPFDSKQ